MLSLGKFTRWSLLKFWMVRAIASVPTLTIGAVALSHSACKAADSVPDGMFSLKNMNRIRGFVIDPEFGYKMKIPPHVKAYVSNGNDANWGVTFIIGPKRAIDMYPDHTGLVPGDDELCKKDQFKWEIGVATKVKKVLMGPYPGCMETPQGLPHTWAVVQANRSDRYYNLIYTFVLKTDQKSSEADLLVLQGIVRGFRKISMFP